MEQRAPKPRVLIVAGSDSGGGAGIQADLKTVSALGAYGTTAITALTAQNTTGVYGVVALQSEFVAQQIDVCVSDIGCDAVKTGMLADENIIRAVAESIRRHKLTNVVVDPVMVAKSGDRLLAPEAVEALRQELMPLAEVVTPNLPEASALLGYDVAGVEGMKEAARRIHSFGPKWVVVKGGHLPGEAVDVLFDGKGFVELSAPRLQTRNTHGTGCCFASAIAAGLAAGLSVPESVQRAKEFISLAIEHGLAMGSGHGPADPMAWVEQRKG